MSIASLGWLLIAPSSPTFGDEIPKLEMGVLANTHDDKAAIEAGTKFFVDAQENTETQSNLAERAKEGEPPPAPELESRAGSAPNRYRWVELASSQLRSLRLDNEAHPVWKEVAKARETGRAVLLPSQKWLMYSRNCTNVSLTPDQRAQKKFDYFVLIREIQNDNAINEKHLKTVEVRMEADSRPLLFVKLNEEGAKRFKELTSKNTPGSVGQVKVYRHLAIILNGQVFAILRFGEAVENGEVYIGGYFTESQIRQMAEELGRVKAETGK